MQNMEIKEKGEQAQELERCKMLLYDAISMLVDETFLQYDDGEEWLDRMLRGLGVSLDELASFGVCLNSHGCICPSDE